MRQVVAAAEAWHQVTDDPYADAHDADERLATAVEAMHAATWGTCRTCSHTWPRSELRLADLGGPGHDDPDVLVCRDVWRCQGTAGELPEDEWPPQPQGDAR